MKVTVLGAGAWGTTLARLLCKGGELVTLWGHDAEHLRELGRTGFNERYLPGIQLPPDLGSEPDLPSAIRGRECVVVAVPSKAFREVTKALADWKGLLVSMTKGIEDETGLTMCGVLRANAPGARIVALSGPTLAMEVAKEMPTAIVAASLDAEAAQQVQQLFHRAAFRVYTGADPLGVELGGALKNVVAIAAGVGDGLGFGDNSKGALITRGIVEIRRLGGRSGGDMLLAAEPQPGFWRTPGTRREAENNPRRVRGRGRGISDRPFGLSPGAALARGHSHPRPGLPASLRRKKRRQSFAGPDGPGIESGGLRQKHALLLENCQHVEIRNAKITGGWDGIRNPGH